MGEVAEFRAPCGDDLLATLERNQEHPNLFYLSSCDGPVKRTLAAMVRTNEEAYRPNDVQMMVALPYTNPDSLECVKWSSRDGFELTPQIISKGPHPKDKVTWIETSRDAADERRCSNDNRSSPYSTKNRLPSKHNFTLRRTGNQKGPSPPNLCEQMRYYKVSDELFRSEFEFPLCRLQVLAIAASVFYSF